MNFFLSLLSSIFITSSIFGSEHLFANGLTHAHLKQHTRRHGVEKGPRELPDLELLKKYVCSREANILNRQDLSSSLTRDQYIALLFAIRSTINSMLLDVGYDPNGQCKNVLNSPAPSTITKTLRITQTRTITAVTTGTVASVLHGPNVAAPSTAVGPHPSLVFGLADPTFATECLASETASAYTQSPVSNGPLQDSPQQGTQNGALTLATKGYTFSASATNNIAAYFGQTVITGTTSLLAQCADPSIDIAIVAFVIGQLNGGPYPTVNFGAACGGQTPAMQAQAPGLLYCPQLASDIAKCQSQYGKKVLLSIGGQSGGIIFSSLNQATAFGDVMWKLFGPTGNIDVNLRPFGTVELDGFDIGKLPLHGLEIKTNLTQDNENNQPGYYSDLATNLRSHFNTARKTYYLSSAPQCPFPDASNPMPMLLQCDFVFVQFYNNGPCEIGSAGFSDSVKQWSDALKSSTLPRKSKLYIGAPAWSAAGAQAYAAIGSPQGIKPIESSVKAMKLGNLGGGMFWDAPEGRVNVGGGKSILQWAKEGLT